MPIPLPLRRNLSRALRGGHPWVFAEALAVPPRLPGGAVVEVVDGAGKFVARGIYDADSPLAVRVWTLDRREAVDGELIGRRVAAAWALRRAVVDFSDTDCFRLLHGEADGLPGIVCDIYGSTAVIRLDTPSVRGLLSDLVNALRTTLPTLERVLLRPFKRDRGESQGEAAVSHAGAKLETLMGRMPDDPLQVRERGMGLEVDLAGGQKTGLYLDQRENRGVVGGLAKGRKVLDLFSYSGGFALAAALGGASSVTAVDAAKPAMAAATRNFALNGLDPAEARFSFLARDAFAFLEADPGSYDLVVLDPPSMAPNQQSVERAMSAYRRLNTLALARIGAGGLLVTASCSSHITEAHLLAALGAAATTARRSVRVLEYRGAGPDHPTLAGFPEGRYLNLLVAWVL